MFIKKWNRDFCSSDIIDILIDIIGHSIGILLMIIFGPFLLIGWIFNIDNARHK